ncbi:MAG: hypothetical protein HC875_25965 [Anaerolineales bacterium]|nr:hypothetical protein [Anaerolineales bacterium]
MITKLSWVGLGLWLLLLNGCDYATPVDGPQSASPPASTAAPTPKPAPGRVSGSICYPGDKNPSVVLYLKNTATGTLIQQEILPSQPRYSLTVPPGEYTAYALTIGTEVAGIYSDTDHRPRPFRVESGQTTTNIDLCDWYNSPGRVAPAPNAAADAVTVTTVQKTNVFAGPGLRYGPVGFAPPLASAPALRRNKDGSWLKIPYPLNDGAAWIYAPLTQVAGPLEDLREAAEPALPLPAKLSPAKDVFMPTAWSASGNEAIVHFKGVFKDAEGRPVNGFSVLADNGTWSVVSHPGGPSRWYPDQRPGQWDIILTNPTDAAGWWTLTVVTYDCPHFDDGFDAQCKEFTRLSENHLVKIVYPDETVINADWVCQRDCNKGTYINRYWSRP